MRKIVFPILSLIFYLTTPLETGLVFAQTPVEDLTSQYLPDRNFKPDATGKITKQKWHKLFKRYYLSRYRTRFESDNNFLSLNEVDRILGFEGKRSKPYKLNYPQQYWSWQDSAHPNQKIEAVFVYNQLVGLRSKGFDRADLLKIKQEFSNRSIISPPIRGFIPIRGQVPERVQAVERDNIISPLKGDRDNR